MKYEPEAFSWKHDRDRSSEIYEQWAERVWSEESANCPEIAAERDYYLGFRDGFVDFVWAGGTGEPPPVPPRHLWNAMLRSPDGKRRADLWFSGYRHGARMARVGGYRELGTIRTSLVDMEYHANGMEYPGEEMGPQLPEHIEPVHQDQVLPAPPAAQLNPSNNIPAGSATSLARQLPFDEPRVTTTAAAPIARPVKKQPAAFEALGLALLPTDQPSTKSGRKLETRRGGRPIIGGMKPTTSPRDRYRPSPRDDASLPESPPVEPNPPVTAIPSTPSRATNSGAKLADRPVPDIVLDRTRSIGQVVTAAHSEPIGDRTTHSATLAVEQPNSNSMPLAPAADEPDCKRTYSLSSPAAERASDTSPTKTIAPAADESRLHLKAGGSTPGQTPGSAVKFLKTTTEPAPVPSAKLPQALGGSSSTKVTISPDDHGRIDRIVIAASPSNTEAEPVTRSQPLSGTIKIRDSTDVVERLRVKAIDSPD